MNPAIVQILCRSDADAIARAIREHFKGNEDVAFQDRDVPPDEHTTLAVFLLTPRSVADDALFERLKQCADLRLPMLPVAEDQGKYSFQELPGRLGMIRERNALGWMSPDPSEPDGRRVLENIETWIGRRLFQRERSLFISYRRSDGADLAERLYRFFRKKDYQVFLDTESIPGASRVQPHIRQAIFERDFLLLIDSPDAKNSEWIQKEIQIAVENRIKIAAIRMPGANMPLFREIPVVKYRDGMNLEELEKVVIENVHATMHFDLKVEEALDWIEKDLGFKRIPNGIRKWLLSKNTGTTGIRNILLEYENAPHSLESLYRLSCGYETCRGTQTPLDAAFFIYAGSPLNAWQQEAVRWAARGTPLEMATLPDFIMKIAR